MGNVDVMNVMNAFLSVFLCELCNHSNTVNPAGNVLDKLFCSAI